MAQSGEKNVLLPRPKDVQIIKRAKFSGLFLETYAHKLKKIRYRGPVYYRFK